jgi:hypothetical protein
VKPIPRWPLLLLLVASHAVCAQNLVPDPGFELYTLCPAAYSSKATSWVDGNTQGSCNFINACSVSAICDVPVNDLGQQAAFAGNGYAHIICSIYGGTYRAYLQAQLTAALV